MAVLELIENKYSRFRLINGNVLKIIALITMTIDHVGAIIFPSIVVLRIIGRIAFPIFAYLIAEGCYFTKSRIKYLFNVFAIGLFCQVIFFISQKSFYQCVLITFVISIILIYLLDWTIKRNSMISWIAFSFAIVLVFFISEILPELVNHTFDIDYGFAGIIFPLAVYIPNYFRKGRNIHKIVISAICIALLVFSVDLSCQPWGFLALIFIALYNGKRGKLRIKFFFYLYYPIHLGIIYFISTLIIK